MDEERKLVEIFEDLSNVSHSDDPFIREAAHSGYKSMCEYIFVNASDAQMKSFVNHLAKVREERLR